MSQPETATQNAIADQTAAPAPAPVEETPAVTETPEETPADQTADPAPAEVEVPEKPEQSKAVKELIAQRKKRQLAEQEAAYWKGVAEANKRQESTEPVAPAPKTVAQDGSPIEPDPNQFSDFYEYEKAREKYLVNLAKYQFKQELEQEQVQKKQQVLTESFQQRLTQAIEADPEFGEIVSDRSLPISGIMLDVIKESEQAPEILKWLHENREDAKKMYYMNPIQVAKKIGALETQLQVKPAPKAEPVKKVSQAPTPIPTVTPAGVTIVDEDDLPMAEYHRRRTQALFKR